MRATQSITKDEEVKTRWANAIAGSQPYLVVNIAGSLSLYIDESELPRFRKALATKKGYKKAERKGGEKE